MSNIKIEYGTASQAITVTLASLASGSLRESTVIDNTTNKFLDALLYLAIKSGGSMAGEKVVKVYFYASEDGTNYTDNATGSDAGLTIRSPTNLRGPFLLQMPTTAVTYKIVIPVAQFFDGVLPPKWGIVINNASGGAFDSTEGNHTKEYRGVYQTVT